MKRIALAILIIMTALVGVAQADSTGAGSPLGPTKYIPDFHGTLRVFYELSTVNGDSRFMVRNARLSAGGYVLPMVDYYLQVDFSDKGKMQLLDAYLRLSPDKRLKLMAGQMRVPFSAAATRSPHKYFFINRSFIGKYAGNLRSVGVKAAYSIGSWPLYIEGGVFNSTSRTDHSLWNSALTYGIKANIRLPGGFTPEVGFMSRQYGLRQTGARFNQFDASLNWTWDRWTVEAEYLMAHCASNFPTSHQYSVFVNYDLPIGRGLVDILALAARFDGHSDATDGYYDAEGRLTVTYPERRRLTVGATTRYQRGKVHFDMRLNYEQYFYAGAEPTDPSENNKLAAAMILYF